MGAIRNLALCLIPLGGPIAAEGVTIAALGDSLTQGYGLSPEAGFVPRLEDWLDENGAGATVVNAGVSGDTTAGGLARIGWTLTEDIDGLIVALGGNDILRGLDPAESRRNLAGILDAAAERDLPVLLIGIDAPSNFGPDYDAEFEAVFQSLAEDYGTILYPDFLGALTAEIGLAEALATYMQPDGIHPNAAGVERIVEDLGPWVLDLIGRIDD